MTGPEDPTTTVVDPDPDPGNSGPEAWTADLDEADAEHVLSAVNQIAVDLPDFDPTADPGPDQPDPDDQAGGAA